MTRPIGELRPFDINRDLPTWEVPPDQWTGGDNVVFRDGTVQRVIGDDTVFVAPAATPFYLINALGEAGNYWVYPAAGNGIQVTDGTTNKVITPNVGPAYTQPTQPRNIWTGGTINGLPFLNWPAASASWDLDFATPSRMVYLPDAPVCRAMRAYDQFLIAMDTGDAGSPGSEYQVRWSGVATDTVPSTWTAAASNLAGDAYLSATRGRIIDGGQLGPSFFIYKQSSAYRMTFVGAPFVMDVELFSTSVGTLTRNCIAEFERNHIVLTDSDVVIHDGGTVRSLIDERNRRWLFSQLGSNYDRSFVTVNPIEREVWICFPTAEDLSPELALVWNASNNRWGVRDLNEAVAIGLGVVEKTVLDSWTSQTATWDTIGTRIWNKPVTSGVRPSLLKGNTTSLYEIDTAATDLVAYVERIGLDFGDRNTTKTVRRVIPRLKAVVGTEMLIRVGTQNTTDVAIQWGDEIKYTVGTDQSVDIYASGKLLGFSFRTSGTNLWSMAGFDVEIELERGNY